MTSNFKTVLCLGYKLFADDLDSISLTQKVLVNTINQYSYCIAEKDSVFKDALCNSDILLPDGVGMTWASKFLNGKKIKKIAGADIHEFLLEKMNKESGSCFYLGASETTLVEIYNKLEREYPNIKVGSYSPPFKPTFTAADSAFMIQKVNDFKPNVLFVGMTAPKQEKWSHAFKEQLNANVICSIGAVFDFYAGSVDRPSEIWINLKLEWLGRLLKEPKRMWKRYIYYGAVFVYGIIKNKVQSKG
ncbi:WecB/TagA/CpsF family glycosyltransferase [uncultured Maribacter sp.]|uniref:WecB/TagA/CpsF family glycosyltransferase n=1 Tax=uncultured Maribacter sp. TaxID=431308 RepID=UPI002605C300|nr:WecB/TagA/CpsF family glycosyltransferase [uncultured Maribacter sp.]